MLAALYEFAADKANAARKTYAAEVAALPNDATSDQLAAIAAPFTAELHACDNTILGLGAAGGTATDIRSLVAADGKLEVLLEAASTQTLSTVPRWSSEVSVAASVSSSADALVRIDLGLPPASTS